MGGVTPRVPVAGDDVYFQPRIQAVPATETEPAHEVDLTVDCDGMHAASGGAYASVQIKTGYTKTVTLSEGFTTGGFLLQDGVVSQPSSGTDITATEWFTWTKGILNSSSNKAEVIVTGANAVGTIAPLNAGSLSTGSQLSFQGGSVGTFHIGTIDFKNLASIDVHNLSTVIFLPTIQGELLFYANSVPFANRPYHIIKEGGRVIATTSRTTSSPLLGKVTSDLPLYSKGTLLIESRTIAFFKGHASGGSTASYEQFSSTSRLAIEDGSTLRVEHGAAFAGGGTIETLQVTGGSSVTATIDGKVTNGGARIKIHSNGVQAPSPDPQGMQRVPGILKVTGNMLLSNATFEVIVVGVDVNKADRIECDGSFTFGTGAAVTVSTVHLPENQGDLVGKRWKILTAVGGIFGTLPQDILYSFPTDGLPPNTLFAERKP